MVRRDSPGGRRADRFYSTRTPHASGTPPRRSALHDTQPLAGARRLGKSLAAIENKHFNELNLCTRMTALFAGPYAWLPQLCRMCRRPVLKIGKLVTYRQHRAR